MKNIVATIIGLTVIALASAAWAADTNCNGPGDDSCGSNSGNNSNTASAGASAGASVSVNNSTRQYAPAPNVYGPGLAAANCMGSWSVGMSGANGIAGGGLGFGATKESKECNRRAYADQLFKLATEYQNPKLAIAGLLLLSENKEVRAALADAGFEIARSSDAKEAISNGTNARPLANAMDHTK